MAASVGEPPSSATEAANSAVCPVETDPITVACAHDSSAAPSENSLSSTKSDLSECAKDDLCKNTVASPSETLEKSTHSDSTPTLAAQPAEKKSPVPQHEEKGKGDNVSGQATSLVNAPATATTNAPATAAATTQATTLVTAPAAAPKRQLMRPTRHTRSDTLTTSTLTPVSSNPAAQSTATTLTETTAVKAAAAAESSVAPLRESDAKNIRVGGGTSAISGTGMKRKAAEDDGPRTRAKLSSDAVPSRPKAPAQPPRARATSVPPRTARLGASSTTSRTGVKKTAPNQAPSAHVSKREDPAAAEAVSSSVAIEAKKKKRPPWDLKGRLQDMEEKDRESQAKISTASKLTAELHDELAQSRQKSTVLEETKIDLEARLLEKERENSSVLAENRQLKEDIDNLKRKHALDIETLENTIREITEASDLKIKSHQEEIHSVNSQLLQSNERVSQLKEELLDESSRRRSVESENQQNKARVEELTMILLRRQSRIDDLESDKSRANDRINELEEKLREEESTRRKLHNTIQELKGNIRVFCRIRPLLAAESGAEEEMPSHLVLNPADDKSITVNHLTEGGTVLKSFPFSFDKVFTTDASQATVFAEISQLVQSALDGYNVSIFAYGQTGSGKTYTMEGVPLDPVKMGMIPRAFVQIFESSEQLKSKGWTYTFEAQFLEIYNETVRDLLGPSSLDKKHEIRHNGGRTTVTDAVTSTPRSPSDVLDLLTKAAHRRAVAATNCNERSSRSHSVFTLRLCGQNSLTEEACEGVLNLIDLAGSERLSSSGSTGDRLKETQAINKSLSCLGDVISALANKEPHIPYRNSKLTYLLQNSLGGSSKTLMFVNISPMATNLQETVCSLRFATKVNSCQIGTAQAKRKL